MKVLTIDDEADIGMVVRMLLESEGWSVEEGSCATEGAARLWKEQFDVVLLDLQMPGLSWMEGVALVREAAPDTPVLILSARADWDLYFEAMDSGVRDVLMKPFRSGGLLAAVKKAGATFPGNGCSRRRAS